VGNWFSTLGGKHLKKRGQMEGPSWKTNIKHEYQRSEVSFNGLYWIHLVQHVVQCCDSELPASLNGVDIN
jgi:hypothetical protein